MIVKHNLQNNQQIPILKKEEDGTFFQWGLVRLLAVKSIQD